jgi:general secretion pathway protein F
MPRFLYQAIDATGQVQRGEMEAASEAELARRIQAQGSMLLRTYLPSWRAKAAGLFTLELGTRRGLGKKAVARLTRELAVMLGSGQDIDHALRFMVSTAGDAASRVLLEDLRDRVRGGKSLASAIAAHPATFSRLYIGLVRAGEAGGTLGPTLANLSDMLERERKLASTIQSAMIYPLVLIIASIGSVVMLLTWVLPQFAPMFAEAGAKLPAATRFIMAAGDVVRAYGLWFLAAAAAAGLAARALVRLPAYRHQLDRLLLKLPIVGSLIQQVEASRLTRTLGTLLANGVGLLAALSISRQVLTNSLAVAAVDDAVARAKEGEGIAGALAQGGAFPPHAVHLLELGSETGRLADMALRAAEIHEEQVRTSVQQLVSLIVPAITIGMGAIVAGIIGSLLVAMMSLNDLAS